MTFVQLDTTNITAGRDTNAMVAHYVFGMMIDKTNWGEWVVNPVYKDIFGRSSGATGWEPKRYSTNIALAWEIMERLKESKPILNYDPLARKWYVRFNGGESYSADTAPLAICTAALQHVKINGKND